MKLLITAAIIVLSTTSKTWGADSPCKQTDAGRAMDLLIGSWDYYTKGKKRSHTTVEHRFNQCAVVFTESQVGGQPSEAPFMYYDDREDMWRQVVGAPNLKERYVVQFSPTTLVMLARGKLKDEGEIYLRDTYTLLGDGSLRFVQDATLDTAGPWHPKKEGLLRRVN